MRSIIRGPRIAACVLCLSASIAWGVPTTYLPLNHRAYDFLERMEHQWFVTAARLGAKPITRARAADLLIRVNLSKEMLSPADRAELACLIDEFAPDIPSRQGLVWDDRGPVERLPGFLKGFMYRNRRNLLSATGSDYSLYLDPVIVRSATVGTLKTPEKDDRVYNAGNGFVMRGTAGEHVGFYIDVRDSKEWGSRDYPPQTLTTMPGRGFVSFKGDRAEFDETNAAVTYTSGPFVIFYGRGGNVWGRGKQGTLGLSGYASPYEMIKIEAEFWRLRYTFLAVSLKQYPPIAQFYYANPPGVFSDSVTVHKRLSGHRLEVDLTDRLNVGLYETVVYGGRWEMSYLNPVMFLRGAEHTNGDHDNVVMGVDFRLMVHRSHSVYGEFLIDDITTTKLGTDWYGNKFGWQIGSFIVEPFRFRDTDARIEYTRINPWVYTHRYPINVYDHYRSTLGYHTGPNSDELSAEIRKRFSRRLHLSLSWFGNRHGANSPLHNIGGDIKLGHRDGDPTESHFLEGILEKRSAVSLDVSYEPFWQLFVRAGCSYEDRNGKGNRIVRFSLGLNE